MATGCIHRRSGGDRRRAGRPRQRDRAGGGRRGNAPDRATGRARSPHHRAPGGFGHGAGNAGVWQACRPHAAPLRKIRIVDDTAAAFPRARGVFRCRRNRSRCVRLQHREPASVRRARGARRASSSCRALPRRRSRSRAMPSGVTIKHADGEARVRLAIGADGARSLCRAAAGISSRGAQLIRRRR